MNHSLDDMHQEFIDAMEPHEPHIQRLDDFIRELGDTEKIPVLAMLLGLARIQAGFIASNPPADHKSLRDMTVLYLDATITYHTDEPLPPVSGKNEPLLWCAKCRQASPVSSLLDGEACPICRLVQ